jgi:hypothetical protein
VALDGAGQIPEKLNVTSAQAWAGGWLQQAEQRGKGRGGKATLLFALQDLAWMVTFYVRIFLTYMPLLGLKGFLGLFFIVR